MGENGRFTGGSFPEGTIGTSIFEDMWPRHPGMPELDELVDAALNARGNEKTNGTWDEKLWDKKELRRRRRSSGLTWKQQNLIALGEAVVALVKQASRFAEDEKRGDNALYGGPITGADGLLAMAHDDEPDGDEVNADEAFDEAAPAAQRVIANALQRPTLGDVADFPGLRDALEHVGPRSFQAELQLSRFNRPPPWATDAAELARWTRFCREREGFDFYYRLRIACGLDDPTTQPWSLLSKDAELQAQFAQHAAAYSSGHAETTGIQGRPAEPGYAAAVLFAKTFADRFDDGVVATMGRMSDPWVFANAIAGEMISQGDPHAEQARKYAWCVDALTGDRARRRLRVAEEKAYNAMAAEALAASDALSDADQPGVEALMDEMERLASEPLAGAIFEVPPKERAPWAAEAWYDFDDATCSAPFDASLVVSECIIAAESAADLFPPDGGWRRRGAWGMSFVRAFRERMRRESAERIAECVQQMDTQLLHGSRAALYETVKADMRYEFQLAADVRGHAVTNLSDGLPKRRAPWERQDDDDSDDGDLFGDFDEAVVAVQFRAAAAIATASKAKGEVWVELFVKSAKTIIEEDVLSAVIAAWSPVYDTWETLLVEEGVPAETAARAYEVLAAS